MANFHFNVASFNKQLGMAKDMLSDKRIGGIIQDETIKAYHLAIEETPQYSGYLASNLRIQVNGVGEGVATDLQDEHENWHSLGKEYGGVKQKGDEYAIGIASLYNRWFNQYESKFQLNDVISIKYLAPHWRTAEVGVKLRDVNKPGKALTRAKASIKGNQHVAWARGLRTGERI